MQISVQGSRMPFHIRDMYIIEFQSGRSQMNRISNRKNGYSRISNFMEASVITAHPDSIPLTFP